MKCPAKVGPTSCAKECKGVGLSGVVRERACSKTSGTVAERFLLVLSTVFDSVVEFDLASGMLTFRHSRLSGQNAAFAFSLEEFANHLCRTVTDARDRKRLLAAFRQCQDVTDEPPVVCRYQNLIRGANRWCETTFVRSGTTVFCCTNDVTDRVFLEHDRLWAYERYRILSDLTSAVTFDYDSTEDTATFYLDRPVPSEGGMKDTLVVRRYFETWPESRRAVIHPDDLDGVLGLLEGARDGEGVSVGDYRAKYRGYDYRWYRGKVCKSFDATGAWHLVGSIEDVQDAYDLRVRAERDSLTGLLNHAAMSDRVNEWLTKGQDGAAGAGVCVALDIDDFKAVNDTYGHLRGDEALIQVSRLLEERCTGRVDIGRVGGDEFVFFFKDARLEDVMPTLELILHDVRRVGDAVDCGQDALQLSVSMGVTETMPEDAVFRAVILRADHALYEAKRAGKNRIRVE